MPLLDLNEFKTLTLALAKFPDKLCLKSTRILDETLLAKLNFHFLKLMFQFKKTMSGLKFR